MVTISNNIIASHVAQKEYPYISEKNDITYKEKKDIFHNIGSVFLYKVSSVLINATDNLIISTIVGTVFVGLYSNYLVLQKSISTVITLIFTSVTASIGNLIVTENSGKRLEIFRCEQSISCIISGIVVPCYVLLADDFINVWLGKEYQFRIITTCVIGLNMYLGCVLQPLWSYREATGLYRRTKWIMLICAVENIVLSILLGIKIGVTGIILASAISRISTYGGGGLNVIIVSDKSKQSKESVIAKLRYSANKLRKKSGGREWAYGEMETGIVVEQLLINKANPEAGINDYKIFCYNGKAKYIIVDVDRYIGHKRNFYDRNWNNLHITSDCPAAETDVPRPERLDEMLKVAEKLSEDFPYVRVDLYCVDGKVYFGELTFYPWSGYVQFMPDDWDFTFGKDFELRRYK